MIRLTTFCALALTLCFTTLASAKKPKITKTALISYDISDGNNSFTVACYIGGDLVVKETYGGKILFSMLAKNKADYGDSQEVDCSSMKKPRYNKKTKLVEVHIKQGYNGPGGPRDMKAKYGLDVRSGKFKELF